MSAKALFRARKCVLGPFSRILSLFRNIIISFIFLKRNKFINPYVIFCYGPLNIVKGSQNINNIVFFT